MRISDWSSDVCSSDLLAERQAAPAKRNAAYGVAGLAEHALRRPTLRPLSCGGARWQPRLRGSPLSRASAEWRQLSDAGSGLFRSEEHTSELKSLMRISYAVFCLKKKKNNKAYRQHRIV